MKITGLLLIAFCLAGCGKTGALYLPTPPADQNTTHNTTHSEKKID